MGCNVFGKLGRLGLAVLKHLQYNKQRHLTTRQRDTLLFHKQVITTVPPRRISVTRKPRRPVIVYSDAEYTPFSGKPPRLGWVVFPTDGGQPVGHSMDLPPAIWATWTEREQYIFPAEAVALPLGTWALA